MNSEFYEYDNTHEFLSKWKDLIENGEQPHDIEIDGLGIFTNAKIIMDDAYNITVTYDEYIKG